MKKMIFITVLLMVGTMVFAQDTWADKTAKERYDWMWVSKGKLNPIAAQWDEVVKEISNGYPATLKRVGYNYLWSHLLGFLNVELPDPKKETDPSVIKAINDQLVGANAICKTANVLGTDPITLLARQYGAYYPTTVKMVSDIYKYFN
jgi:hypothetical protein